MYFNYFFLNTFSQHLSGCIQYGLTCTVLLSFDRFGRGDEFGSDVLGVAGRLAIPQQWVFNEDEVVLVEEHE